MPEEADTRDIQGKEPGAFGFFDGGRWRVSFAEVDVWLPAGLTREQAEAIVNLVPGIYYQGRSDGVKSMAHELAMYRNSQG